MFLFYTVIGGLYACVSASVTTEYPHTVTRAGYEVNITMNITNARTLYYVSRNGPVHETVLLVVLKPHRVEVFNTSDTGYTTRIRYTGEVPLSQTGQLRFTIYNVTVQDAGTYYCHFGIKHIIPCSRQILVVSRKPTTPAPAVSGANVTLTCSSSSRSLPPDHPPLNMIYTWRRNRTLLGSGDGSHTGGDVLTITHISRENQGDIYTCQAVEEGLESDWSHGQVLEVYYGPVTVQFNDNRDDVSAVEGDPLTVRCSADCHPACTVTWWDTSRQREITGQREAVLYIPAVDRSMSGQYTCHANNIHGNTSRGLTLKVSSREVTEAAAVSIVPVAAVCSVLIVVIALVVIFVIRRKQTGQERGHIHNHVVAYTRDAETDGSYQEIKERGYINNRSISVVSYIRDEENEGTYQEIEEDDVNVDDIVPIVAVYSVILTAVTVVVAAVAILGCKEVKDVVNISLWWEREYPVTSVMHRTLP